jgi:hypothetical protein
LADRFTHLVRLFARRVVGVGNAFCYTVITGRGPLVAGRRSVTDRAAKIVNGAPRVVAIIDSTIGQIRGALPESLAEPAGRPAGPIADFRSAS